MFDSKPIISVNRGFGLWALCLGMTLLAIPVSETFSAGGYEKVERAHVRAPDAPASQTAEQMAAKSDGCESCHTTTDQKTMHANPAVKLGCTDCHGGDAGVYRPEGTETVEQAAYFAAMEQAHVLPNYPEAWHYPHTANPEQSYTLLNSESP